MYRQSVLSRVLRQHLGGTSCRGKKYTLYAYLTKYVDEGGETGLTAYLRVAEENIVAHPLQVRAWENSDREDLAPLNTPLSSSILQLVDSAAISPDRLAYKLHVTREAADATAARLLAAGLLTMLHTKHGFVLTASIKE